MSLKGLERRVEKLEEYFGRNRHGATIMIYPGETREQAMERHFREHPNDDPKSKFNIIMDFREGEVPAKLNGETQLAPPAENQGEATHREGLEASENSAGRLRGGGSDLTQSIEDDLRDSEEVSSWPLMLDKNLPYDAWDGLFCQKGVWFRRDNLKPIHPGASLPVQPEKLDIRGRRLLITWKGEECYLQEGWLFSASTHKVIKF